MYDTLDKKTATFLEATLTSTNLEFIINQAAQYLGNPVAVFDANYYTLAYSDISQVEDTVWIGGKQRGYCLYEYAARLQRLISADNPYAILSDFGSHRRRIQRLTLNDIPVGFFSVLESHVLFDHISPKAFQLVSQVLAKELVFTRDAQNIHRSSDSILLDLLNSGFANRVLFDARISGSDFAKPTTYCILAMEMNSFLSCHMGEHHLKSLIAQYLPGTWSVFFKEHVIVLIDWKNKQYQREDSLAEFQLFLQQNRIIAGMSDCFDDLFSIRVYYKQALQTLHLAKPYQAKGEISKFDDYKLLFTVKNLPKENALQYCSAVIRRMHEWDITYETEYVPTLFAYLDSDKSLMKTATRLQVHRNTVVYRLDRMKELFQISFDSAYHTIQMYYSCLILQHM